MHRLRSTAPTSTRAEPKRDDEMQPRENNQISARHLSTPGRLPTRTSMQRTPVMTIVYNDKQQLKLRTLNIVFNRRQNSSIKDIIRVTTEWQPSLNRARTDANPISIQNYLATLLQPSNIVCVTRHTASA